MKTNISSVIILLITIIFLNAACKKSDNNTIEGNWEANLWTAVVYKNNQIIHVDTYYYAKQERILECRADLSYSDIVNGNTLPKIGSYTLNPIIFNILPHEITFVRPRDMQSNTLTSFEGTLESKKLHLNKTIIENHNDNNESLVYRFEFDYYFMKK
jgi:hypothetical protein